MPYEKKIHEIYVYTKQLSGKRHPLYRHDGTTFVPDLHCLTTQQMLDEFKFVKDDKLLDDIVINNTQEFANSIEKVIPIDNREEALCKPEMPDAEKKLVDFLKDKDYVGFKTQPNLLEFSHRESNKGYALRKYCELHNIDLDDCYGFGDTTNDNEMLKTCHGVCLLNGSDDTKACAEFITDKAIENDGFADFVYKHLL